MKSLSAAVIIVLLGALPVTAQTQPKDEAPEHAHTGWATLLTMQPVPVRGGMMFAFTHVTDARDAQ